MKPIFANDPDLLVFAASLLFWGILLGMSFA